MGEVIFKRVDINQIELIRCLWEQLTVHHKQKTTYFKERFENLSFETRKASLLEKAENGELIIDVAILNKGIVIAYCISSMDFEHHGEVDSLFVDENYRNMKVGDELMNRAMNWFEQKNAKTLKIVVAEGNEDVFSFYKKFDFYPIFNVLQHKK